MAITTILFDLDGTLLPMDQEQFVHAYLKGLCAKAAPHGYDHKKMADSIWAGVGAMVKNSGGQTNEAVFWKSFAEIHGQDSLKDIPLFDDYYRNEFQRVQSSCGFQPMTKPLIDMLKEKGLRLVLATNPIFPQIATESRIRWAGIQPEDFCLYTTYENSRHSKPNLDYYRDILDQLHLAPEQCMMVGNDVEEDMIAAQLGMKVFLLTDCLISRSNADLVDYPHGNFQQLFDYLKETV